MYVWMSVILHQKIQLYDNMSYVNRPVLRIFRWTYQCFQSWNKATITLRSIRVRHMIYVNTSLSATNYSRQNYTEQNTKLYIFQSKKLQMHIPAE